MDNRRTNTGRERCLSDDAPAGRKYGTCGESRRWPPNNRDAFLIDEQTWIEWRCKMGCRKAEARQLYREYLKLVQQSGGAVRMVRPRHNESWESAYKAFIDALPRRPSRFLAMVAESNRRRELKEQLEAKKAVGRARYLRRFRRKSGSTVSVMHPND